jgi:hypothetical protein
LATTVAASSSDPYGDGNFYRPQNVADGGTNTASYGSQWSNDCRKDAATQARPAWVELQWPTSIRTRTIVIYTMRGSEIRDYAIQYWDGAVWRVFGDAEVRGNTQARREHTVPTPVETTKIRFLGRQGAPGEPAIVRVVELQVIPDGPPTP